MQLEPRDLALLHDISAACSEIETFIRGMSRAAYLKDSMTQRAIERDLEIIGEAAKGLSDEIREEMKELPWRAIIGLRNVLIHNYGKVDPAMIWETIDLKVPQLQKRISKIPELRNSK